MLADRLTEAGAADRAAADELEVDLDRLVLTGGSAGGALTAGLILDTVTRGRREAKRMRYLEIPSMLSILARRNACNG